MSIEVPFVDLTQVTAVRVDSYHYIFLFKVPMFKSLTVKMFSHFLVAELKVFEASLKKTFLCYCSKEVDEQDLLRYHKF